jgi:hypothetical protein
MKHLNEFKLNEEKDFYPEFKEMRYTNISDVKNDLESLNKFFIKISPILKNYEGGNFSYGEVADMWRKVERSIKQLDNELKINK